ncbi:glycosyltransferase [Planktothrix agardhii]|uniref:glycosyltransferase n=1 Tax=Planktothrix agardhii TaxID=1160 RepID=UPI0012DDC136
MDSVYQQTFTDFEIIVIDDSFTGEMLSQLKVKYPLINYIHQPDQGKAKLINHSFPFPFLIQQALNRVE